MARVRIPLVVLDSGGRPLAGATVAVTDRVTGAARTVYAAETGAAALGAAEVVSDAQGRVPGWTDRGRLQGLVTPPAGSGLAAYPEFWDAAPAGDGDIDTAWVADDAITTPKIVETAVHMIGTYAARPPASAALNGVTYFASDKAMEWLCAAGAWAFLRAYAPEVAALPANPIDQQECVYIADAANGVKWHLRYRAAAVGPYKWEVIGAGSLYARVNADEGTMATAAYADLATVGPSIAAPLAGDYEYDAGATAFLPVDNGSRDAYLGIKTGAGNTATVDRVTIYDYGTPSANLPLVAGGLVTPAAAGDVVKLQYQTSGLPTAAVRFSSRYLRLRPRRVG
jgi:hypothetical protein